MRPKIFLTVTSLTHNTVKKKVTVISLPLITVKKFLLVKLPQRPQNSVVNNDS
jgi:hypothetical protein